LKISLKYIIGLLFIGCLILLSFFTERSDFYQLILLYTALFSLSIFAYRNANDRTTVRFFIVIAILARFILLFSFPNLSDDIFRFIWDGKLWHIGMNPFDALPSNYMNNSFPNGLSNELYEQLNSPNYFTIYPPIAQFTFYVATFIDDFWWNSVIMKFFLLAAEIGTITLLYKYISNKKILLYALNPLILIEIMGNLHFEGAMIFFLLLAFHLLKQQRFNVSAIAFALSIAAKLLPLMFLPFLIHKLGWRKSIQYFVIVGTVTLALFYPLLGSFFMENFGNSLNLYFQKFEFNASLYYVFRWIGFKILGFNLIQVLGPALALIVGITIMVKALKNKSTNLNELPQQWLFAITLYLFCITTVHPWYVALPIVLSLFTNFRYPIIWSAVIFLTYVNYSYAEYFENIWMVGIEYVLVFGYLGWEIFGRIKEDIDLY
jgi:alpha-1,6-mannosyltransferase